MELSIGKLSFIEVVIELQLALAVFLSFDKGSRVDNSVLIHPLDTFSFIHVIFPLSLVHCAVAAYENTLSVGFTVLELALVNITIFMSHSSLAFEQAIFSLSFVYRFICELDCSKSFVEWVFVIGRPVSKHFSIRYEFRRLILNGG